MKRERYAMILPFGVFAVVGIGFLLGIIFPDLSESFYLYLALGAGAAVLVIDGLARSRVREAITDERIRGLAEGAALTSFRIAAGTIGIFAIGTMAILPSGEAARLLAVGAALTIGLQGFIFSIAFAAMKSKY